ncbi:MAG: carbohydrate-binding domain-containing protein [Peptoclostridium sp.]|uniref:carbohydrate-binding domain-containing protein n=1 Tax=Peptoclostridium sp. TaxID=1904860 RepID=UPI00139E0690|nr:carbohydrate-binding domain-containing protein [Peptoclostridium sp.]MZQ75782.1 carbohydrate-binding domain-containing protein [Peptoclostridium sp.]
MNRIRIKLLSLLAAALLASSVLTGCSNDTSSSSSTSDTANNIQVEYSSEDIDGTWDDSAATKVSLSGNSIAVDGSGASASGGTLTIKSAGTYVLSGTLTDGQIVVDSGQEDTVKIVLNGAELKSSNSAPIYSKQSKKTIVTLAKGTNNKIEDAASYDYAEGADEPDAAVFSQNNLTINGSGSLTVKGNFNNGICSKDDLVITGGNIAITSANDALRGRDSIAINGGTFAITAGGDGLQSNNDEDVEKGWISIDGGVFKITAESDGIQATTSLVVNSGTIDIFKCYEGLEGSNVTVNGGSIKIKADDDGLNAAGGNDGSSVDGRPSENASSDDSTYFIRINSGYVTVDAAGDGIDANGSLYFSGGTVLVNGPTNNGNGALDYDRTCEVTGGTLVIAGSSGMAQAPGDTSSQSSLTVYYSTVQKAGTLVTLSDDSGKPLLSFAPSKDYQSIVISSPELEQGKTYTLSSGGTNSGKLKDGLYTGGTVSGATKLADIKLSNIVTRISDDGSEVAERMGGPGGMGGQGRPEGSHDGNRKPPEGMEPPDGMQPPEDMTPPAQEQ